MALIEEAREPKQGYVFEPPRHQPDMAESDPAGVRHEQYVDGRLAIHVHVRAAIPTLKADATQFCAVYERANEGGHFLLGQGRELSAPAPFDFVELDLGERARKHPVLVRVGDGLDERERVGVGPLQAEPSVVRLQTLDECERFLAYETLLDEWYLREMIRRSADRELDLTFDLHDALSAHLARSEFPSQVVERGQAFVRDLADQNAEFRRRLLSYLEASDVPAGIAVEVYPDSIRVAIKEQLALELEGLKVFDRPVLLRHRAFKSGDCHEVSSP